MLQDAAFFSGTSEISGLGLGDRGEPGWGLAKPTKLIGHPDRPSFLAFRPNRELFRGRTAKAEPQIL